MNTLTASASEQPDTQPAPQHDDAMASGTALDQYIVERVLARGGFSIVYLARQKSDQQQVVIKEYLPARFAHRVDAQIVARNAESERMYQRGRQIFLDEARTLSMLKHPNIVRVLNFFLTNGTAYLVMNYDYGRILGDEIKRKDLMVTREWLLDIFPPLMRSLKVMHHRGLLHLDIKPDNIMLRPDNNPLLLDFGAAIPFGKSKQPRAHTMTRGFSAPEQYTKDQPLQPSCDIYALGATMRACLDRRPPPDASDRIESDPLKPAAEVFQGTYPEALLQAIDWAMQIKPLKRPQSMDDFLRALLYL